MNANYINCKGVIGGNGGYSVLIYEELLKISQFRQLTDDESIWFDQGLADKERIWQSRKDGGKFELILTFCNSCI